MILVHAADLHLGVSRYIDRLPDMASSLALLARDARDADALLLAGDTFDSRRPGPDALRVFADFLASRPATTTVIVPGNHDGMTTIGDAETHALLWLKGLNLPNVHVLLRPGWHAIATGAGPLAIFALPYPHKRGLDELLADVPVDERANVVGSRVEQMIRQILDAEERPEGPQVFLGHVSILHAKLGSEARMKMGWDAAIDASVLGEFDYAALGHIHRQQRIATRVWYAGSPEYLDFGDTEGEKGWLRVRVERGTAAEVVQRPSHARPMLTVTVDQQADGVLVPLIPTGDALWSLAPIVRLLVRATVARPKPSELAELTKAVREKGAAYVKTEVRLDLPQSAPVAAQEVTAESDPLTLLHEYLTEKGQPDEPAMGLARALLASLDAA